MKKDNLRLMLVIGACVLINGSQGLTSGDDEVMATHTKEVLASCVHSQVHGLMACGTKDGFFEVIGKTVDLRTDFSEVWLAEFNMTAKFGDIYSHTGMSLSLHNNTDQPSNYGTFKMRHDLMQKIKMKLEDLLKDISKDEKSATRPSCLPHPPPRDANQAPSELPTFNGSQVLASCLHIQAHGFMICLMKGGFLEVIAKTKDLGIDFSEIWLAEINMTAKFGDIYRHTGKSLDNNTDRPPSNSCTFKKLSDLMTKIGTKFDELRIEMCKNEEMATSPSCQCEPRTPRDSSRTHRCELPTSPSTWTSHQVELYFMRQGLPCEAEILRQQEIDGTSLMLLHREDVIKGMGLNLGPALKVYHHVAQIQNQKTRCSDFTN